ncbi:uncharacterized protein LOC134216681 [Armigeres subalbatus]|uniref:uncharacterized protein LOC134216681 n=1 Tax=Armigeres subalbatus TaxID=124917 RepID=UPI002ECFFFDE
MHLAVISQNGESILQLPIYLFSNFTVVLEHKFTDESLKYITDDYLTKIGITEMGPRLIINSTISMLLEPRENVTIPSSPDVTIPSFEAGTSSFRSGSSSLVTEPSFKVESSAVAGPSSSGTGSVLPGISTASRHKNVTTEGALPFASVAQIRERLESDNKFRRILYTKLDANVVPTHTELLKMVRLLCRDMVWKLVNNQEYPTFNEKKGLAKQIVDAFPILRNTKMSENAPDYSLFFWRNGGNKPGAEHSGLIQSHLRNACKDIPSDRRKFVHRKSNTMTSITPDGIQKAQEVACVDPISSNFHNILRVMNETHELLTMCLRDKKRVADILSLFPHLKAYNGVMIQKAYERINVNYNKSSHLKQIFSRGLMLENDNFNAVHDDNLRGCLRILMVLGKRGTRKPIGVETLEIEEQIAAPLIRWIPDHGTALAEQLAKYVGLNVTHKVEPHLITNNENYYIYLEGEIIDCGKSSIQAIDVFIKTFCVFGIPVPATIRKLVEFFEIVSYKIKANSRTVGVKRLVSLFAESLTAEMNSD